MEVDSNLFKTLKSFTEQSLRDEIMKYGKIIQAKKGDILIREGQYLDFLPIVLKGQIRVYQEKEDREMMSLSSAYFDYSSKANGIAVKPTEILVLPAQVIADWQLKYPSWNNFIIGTFKSRYDELLNAFGNVAFKPIHVRVNEYLQGYVKSQNSTRIPLSHQTLANELGTTRVVISRILKQFEAEKKVKLYRGLIHVKA
jgi:CRP/FNR family transcriptional regulator